MQHVKHLRFTFAKSTWNTWKLKHSDKVWYSESSLILWYKYDTSTDPHRPAALMQKVSGEASTFTRLQPAGAPPRRRLSQGPLGILQHGVLDAVAVRDSVASAFDAMERSVSAQSAAMEEQRWLWLMDAEEMSLRVFSGRSTWNWRNAIVIRGKDVRHLHCIVAELLLRIPRTTSNLWRMKH